MWAGIAAVRVGERRILELVDKYGVDTFVDRDVALHGLRRAGLAARARASCRRAASRSTEEQDSGAVYSVTVEITDDEFIVDLRDNPDQDPGPNNGCRDASMISAQMVFKNVTEPQSVANGGTFRPLKLLTRNGSVFDAKEPAAFAIYYEVMVRLYDLIWRCLARAPRRPPAGRELRVDLRDVHRRDASRHRAPLHDRRAADRRLGRLARRRRQQRDLQRHPRRHVQLPGRGRRGALRPVRRAARAERRARRRGRAPRRQGHRPRLPRAHRRLLLHLRVHAQQAPAVGARRRARGLAELRRGLSHRRNARGVRGRHRARGQRGRRDPHPHRQRRRLRRSDETRIASWCSRTSRTASSRRSRRWPSTGWPRWPSR